MKVTRKSRQSASSQGSVFVCVCNSSIVSLVKIAVSQDSQTFRTLEALGLLGGSWTSWIRNLSVSSWNVPGGVLRSGRAVLDFLDFLEVSEGSGVSVFLSSSWNSWIKTSLDPWNFLDQNFFGFLVQ